MGFWTSQRIESNLAQLIERPGGPAVSADEVDCNAFTLTVGDEVYISPSEGEEDAPTRSIQQLKGREGFTIPPGQFAFIMSQEVVHVPTDAMAFISMKAGLKFQGLVNVSGFHVDPGYKGKLVFAVFNAGPRPVILRQAEPAFLIWYADLSNEPSAGNASTKHKNGSPNQRHLDGKTVGAIAGEMHSFQGLLSRMKESEKKLSERLHSIERDHTVLKWAVTVMAGMLVSVITRVIFYGANGG